MTYFGVYDLKCNTGGVVGSQTVDDDPHFRINFEARPALN